MHSETELSRKLEQRGYEPSEIAGVIATCLRLGYLDDAAYATALVNRRVSSRGAAAMAAELRAKGVRRGVVDAALAPIDRETEIEAAVAHLARYARPGSDTSARALLERVGSRLQRRGYGPQVVREAWRRYLAAAGAD